MLAFGTLYLAFACFCNSFAIEDIKLVHGTALNLVLPFAKHTGYALRSYGNLVKQGFCPFSGEQQSGNLYGGVNFSSVSFYPGGMVNFKKAARYALGNTRKRPTSIQFKHVSSYETGFCPYLIGNLGTLPCLTDFFSYLGNSIKHRQLTMNPIPNFDFKAEDLFETKLIKSIEKVFTGELTVLIRDKGRLFEGKRICTMKDFQKTLTGSDSDEAFDLVNFLFEGLFRKTPKTRDSYIVKMDDFVKECGILSSLNHDLIEEIIRALNGTLVLVENDLNEFKRIIDLSNSKSSYFSQQDFEFMDDDIPAVLASTKLGSEKKASEFSAEVLVDDCVPFGSEGIDKIILLNPSHCSKVQSFTKDVEGLELFIYGIDKFIPCDQVDSNVPIVNIVQESSLESKNSALRIAQIDVNGKIEDMEKFQIDLLHLQADIFIFTSSDNSPFSFQKDSNFIQKLALELGFSYENLYDWPLVCIMTKRDFSNLITTDNNCMSGFTLGQQNEIGIVISNFNQRDASASLATIDKLVTKYQAKSPITGRMMLLGGFGYGYHHFSASLLGLYCDMEGFTSPSNNDSSSFQMISKSILDLVVASRNGTLCQTGFSYQMTDLNFDEQRDD